MQPPLLELGRGIHPALFKIEEARPQHSQQAGFSHQIMEDQFVTRIISIFDIGWALWWDIKMVSWSEFLGWHGQFFLQNPINLWECIRFRIQQKQQNCKVININKYYPFVNALKTELSRCIENLKMLNKILVIICLFKWQYTMYDRYKGVSLLMLIDL